MGGVANNTSYIKKKNLPLRNQEILHHAPDLGFLITDSRFVLFTHRMWSVWLLYILHFTSNETENREEQFILSGDSNSTKKGDRPVLPTIPDLKSNINYLIGNLSVERIW